MKYFIILILLLSACTAREIEVENPSVSYSLDTVRINSKNEILDLWGFASFSDLDFEKKSIFSYNSFNHSLDQIDLEKLEFIKRIAFEKEGPNGTGEIFTGFNVLKDDRIFIKSYEKSAIFDDNGILIKKVDWRNSIDSIGEKYGDYPRIQVIVESEDLLVFGLSYDYKNVEVNLDVLSIKENKVDRLDLNSKKSYGDLSIRSDQSGTIIDPSVELTHQNNKIIISYEFSNEIIYYDYKAKALKFVDYKPTLTPKSVNPPNISVGSMEQIKKEIKHFKEQVRYYRPVWDIESKQYFRLSTKTIFSEENKELSNATHIETQEIKVFLTVFDSEFKLLSELEIEEFSDFDNDYFTKDGKLWLLLNLDDEMGFVRISLNNVTSKTN
ncbi:DUF4221 family protein [Algoriphagus aquimarinus]|uniref:DUF4221 domain-containing protein n=1 Tax=Algoriphagus aquimarinus TaxID=237018 RepID=A0A5C7ACW2_9BACT|nr:DUF4221 family protein [Algoriphagus aquimarinus]TXE06438.1 DUF4221 domain-containing protein [Algoriphagus aquimarinus]